MEPAISAIATLTCSGTANPSPAGVSILSFWYFLVTAVPCSKRCLGGRPTPTSRAVRAGDRHLNFYETRDNLRVRLPSAVGLRRPRTRRHRGTLRATLLAYSVRRPRGRRDGTGGWSWSGPADVRSSRRPGGSG